MNMQDIDIATKLTGKFNVETGLWDYQALSHHKPSKMMDTKLIKNTEDRNKYITSTNIDESTGLYGSYEVKPPVVNPDGTPIQCQCGSQFSEESPPIFEGSGMLYTWMGAIETHYYNVSCEANECTLPFTQEAEKKNIFLYTKSTACGDEIGWDFIQSVMKTKISFTAFCDEMT